MYTELFCPRELKSMLGGWVPAMASFSGDEIHPVSPRSDFLCFGSSREVGEGRETRALYILAAGGIIKRKIKRYAIAPIQPIGVDRRYYVAHINELPASLKVDRARMNDRIKHKQVTSQMNHQKADPKANASVFLFFSNAHFLKTIFSKRTNGTFGFARHTSLPFAKIKEPFFADSFKKNS